MSEVTHDTVRKDSRSLGETNDCAVVAVATATRYPYKNVHTVFGALGRKDRDGSDPEILERALIELRQRYVVRRGHFYGGREYPRRQHVCRGLLNDVKTAISAERILEQHFRGRVFLLRYRAHVGVFDGEKLCDAVAGTRRRIHTIIEILPEG